MTADPLVTVVIPTHDRPEMLRDTVASVLGQTYRNLEVLVCDDGQTPETKAVLEELADPRLVHTLNPTWFDLLANAASGWSSARGEFIGMCHDDDRWHPEFVERVLPPLIEHPEVVVSFSDSAIIDIDGVVDEAMSNALTERWGRANLAPGVHQPFRDLAVAGTIPMQIGILTRRGSLDWASFPPEVAWVYDRWMAYQLSRDGGAAWYVPEKLTFTRQHPGTEHQQNVLGLATAGHHCFSVVLADPAFGDERPQVRSLLADYKSVEAMSRVRLGDVVGARAAIDESLRLEPTPRRRFLQLLTRLPGHVATSITHALDVSREKLRDTSAWRRFGRQRTP